MAESVQRAVEDGRRLLGDCFLFQGLGTEERRSLTTRAHIRRFGAGDTIFLMGSPGTSMMAVLAGEVRISISSPEGKELLLAILQPGEVFGEIALLDGKERSADAKAHTACTLAVLDRRDVLAFFERHPHVWPRIVEVLCDRFRENTQHVAEVALMHLPGRLARALLRMQDDPRTRSGALSQRELGNMVGAARETVNKCLNEWQRRGIIRIDDNAVAILDRPALEQLSS
ncbi:MAG TPA: Crp/Fnr family transcriptional regulator [Stellaceae bacterium]|nr:Crp/Fnr family transcriptional regulator [Stellaceae bacterium]